MLYYNIWHFSIIVYTALISRPNTQDNFYSSITWASIKANRLIQSKMW